MKTKLNPPSCFFHRLRLVSLAELSLLSRVRLLSLIINISTRTDQLIFDGFATQKRTYRSNDSNRIFVSFLSVFGSEHGSLDSRSSSSRTNCFKVLPYSMPTCDISLCSNRKLARERRGSVLEPTFSLITDVYCLLQKSL